MTNAKLEPELAKAIKTELVARVILGPPDDDYKQGFNDAMRWAVDLVERYKQGRGIFQDIIEEQNNG